MESKPLLTPKAPSPHAPRHPSQGFALLATLATILVLATLILPTRAQATLRL